VIQRFRAALTCGGYNPANPENLVKDDKGDFVLFSDVKKIKAENERLREALEKIANDEMLDIITATDIAVQAMEEDEE